MLVAFLLWPVGRKYFLHIGQFTMYLILPVDHFSIPAYRCNIYVMHDLYSTDPIRQTGATIRNTPLTSELRQR